jgi:RNA polymerase sigma-70 factor (ECF subfamily)
MTASWQQTLFEEPELAKPAAAVEREQRFTDLVHRQSRFVFRVAFSLLRNAHDAEDVVQEAFLKIYRSGRWDEIQDERGFLARTAWRLAADRLPKRVTVAPDLETAASDADPESSAIASDWNAAIHRMVDALPEELRQPLALSTVEELTSKEIAQVLGVPEGTVRTRIMRARQLLKQKLAGMMERRYGR